MRALLFSLVVSTSLGLATDALADDAPPASIVDGAQQEAQRRVIVLPGTIVYGRLPKPTVAVEIDRIAPKLTVSEKALPLVQRIEATLYDALF